MRNPGRTATTAAALMVGLGLVVFVAVFANGIKASFDDTVDPGGQGRPDRPLRDDAADPRRGRGRPWRTTPEVAAPSSVLIDQVKVERQEVERGHGHHERRRPVELRVALRGRLGRRRRRACSTAARQQRRSSRSSSRRRTTSASATPTAIETPTGGNARLRVIGVYRDPQLLQGMIVSAGAVRRDLRRTRPVDHLRRHARRRSDEAARRRAGGALEGFPAASGRVPGRLRAAIERRQLDQFVYLLYALLAMSVVISLFGIANSLFLSIHERTREFGLLRAVGATRAQVRQMVRYESVITAVIGGLLGIGVGLLFAFLVTESLGDLGLGFAPPLGPARGLPGARRRRGRDRRGRAGAARGAATGARGPAR